MVVGSGVGCSAATAGAGLAAQVAASKSEGQLTTVQPALAVMGTRGLSGVRGVIAGSVSHGVSAHSRVPVLIVPPED